MVISHLQFGLILIRLVVVIIDSEELKCVAINFCLAYDVSLGHLYIGLAIAGVPHHDCNLLDRYALL